MKFGGGSQMTAISMGFKIFLSQVNQFMHDSKGSVWFRGHSNIGEEGTDTKYTLDSTLFRTAKDGNDIKTMEKNYVYEFMTKGYSLHQTKDEWDLLYIMQHYGAPTRLLDWTTSLATALFFATQNWEEGNNKPSIWILNPSKLNEKLAGGGSLVLPSGDFESYVSDEKLQSAAIAPLYNSPRLIAQQGQFTLQGNFNGDLKAEIDAKDSRHSDILMEIELSMDLKEDIFSYLHMNGVNDYSIFPDLDGLSRLVNKRRKL